MVVRMSESELEYPGSRNRGPFGSRSDALVSVVRCVGLAYLVGTVAYRALPSPPTPAEDAIASRIELVSDDELDDTEALVQVEIDGNVSAWHGRGDTLLFPSWDDVVTDLAGLARRAEAPTERVRALAELVSHGASSAELFDAVSHP
jgi:hypothetical protein